MHPEQLNTVLTAIAETLLSVPIRRADVEIAFGDDALVARIHYRGDFRGELAVTFGLPLACALTRLMIGGSGDTCSRADVFDAIGEIANIAAGNLRGLLSHDCQLSLPSICALPALPSAAEPLLASTTLLMLEEPLRVQLHGALA